MNDREREREKDREKESLLLWRAQGLLSSTPNKYKPL